MNRACEPIEEEIWEHARSGRDLAPDTRRHVEECERCRHVLREATIIMGYIQKAAVVPDAPDCRSDVIGSIEEQRVRLSVVDRILGLVRRSSGPSRVWAGAAAAAAILLVCLGISNTPIGSRLGLGAVPGIMSHDRTFAVIMVRGTVTDGRMHGLRVGDRLSRNAMVVTGEGGRVTLVTRTGSELHLDSNSRVSTAGGSAVLIARGRIYCVNRAHEFRTIDTTAGRIRLLGTTVDAAVLSKDKAAVTVVEGRVQLANSHGDALVAAGSRSILASSTQPEPGAPVNTMAETAWCDGRSDMVSDAGEIVYTVNRGQGLSEVWAMRADGSNKHRVKTYVGNWAETGRWWPGSNWVEITPHGFISPIFSPMPWDKADVGSATSSTIGGIRLLNTATGQEVSINPRGYDVRASLSPDGKWLALDGYRAGNTRRWVDQPGLWVMNVQTGEIRQVYRGRLGNPAWMPDSRHVIAPTLSAHKLDGDCRLMMFDTATGDARDLGVIGAGASVSPDGSRVAYTGGFTNPHVFRWEVPLNGSIFVLDLQKGGEPVPVSEAGHGGILPHWSPDGTRILYADAKDGADFDLCVARPDGSGSIPIYHGNHESLGSSVAWAPDGKTVYVEAGKARRDYVLAIAADGSGRARSLGGNASDSVLSSDEETQMAAASSDIEVINYRMEMAVRFAEEQDRPGPARAQMQLAADALAAMPWEYPLLDLSIPDTLAAADALRSAASLSDARLIEWACALRVNQLGSRIEGYVHNHIRSGAGSFPPDLAALTQEKYTMQYHIPAQMAGGKAKTIEVNSPLITHCPGTPASGPVEYVYHAPERPGDAILTCPIHRRNTFILTRQMTGYMPYGTRSAGRRGK